MNDYYWFKAEYSKDNNYYGIVKVERRSSERVGGQVIFTHNNNVSCYDATVPYDNIVYDANQFHFDNIEELYDQEMYSNVIRILKYNAGGIE